MADDVTRRNRDDDVSVERKLDDLYELIDGIEVAMMTTRRPDGRLVSRAMATQRHERDADLWFVTNVESHKLDELAADPHVNLAYYKPSSREWVSVSGTARIVQDRARVRDLYRPDWKAWFPEEGPGRDGGPDDPRIALVYVEADSVVYSRQDQPRPVTAFRIARAALTGAAPKVADVRHLDRTELGGGEARP